MNFDSQYINTDMWNKNRPWCVLLLQHVLPSADFHGVCLVVPRNMPGTVTWNAGSSLVSLDLTAPAQHRPVDCKCSPHSSTHAGTASSEDYGKTGGPKHLRTV